MIAHEMPVSFRRDQKPKAMPLANKFHTPGVQIPPQEATLPNGARVDFGNRKGDATPSSANKKRNDKRAAKKDKAIDKRDATKDLRSGANSDKLAPPKLAESSLPNVDKLTISAVKSKLRSSTNSSKKKSGEVTYAGSSFHSSPAAMALPKPSFRASPKSDARDPAVVPSSCSSTTASSSSTPSVSHMIPSNMQPAPNSHKSPQYPVTAYQPTGAGANPNPNTGFQLYPPGQVHIPPHMQPGFAYHFTPQGYLQYNHPQGMSDHSYVQPSPQGGPYYPQAMPPRPMPNLQMLPMPPPPPPPHQQHQHQQMYVGGPQITSFYQQPGYYGFPGHGQVPPLDAGSHKISFNDLIGSAK